MTFRTIYFPATIALALSLTPNLVKADDSNTFAFEEVVVVAEKRNESLQDVSQAVTPLSSETLDAKNIISFVDLSSIAPASPSPKTKVSKL